jgi:NADH dehydrogenase [ubiquinone] 1 alpha subcomplex assembly factor 7
VPADDFGGRGDIVAMEKTLSDVIKAQIRTSGPMNIATYMGLALGHPKLGYYMTRDPLGARGDFTTAPEISQLFCEMIALCSMDAWIRAGKPDIHLVELGPGRGTLMADFLRSAKNAPDLYERTQIHLVETSPVLRAAQAKALPAYKPTWHDSIDTLPTDAPLLIIANEFFDALPIRQAVMTPQGWKERMVGMDADGKLMFGLGGSISVPRRGTEGDVYEFSPARDEVMKALCARLQKQGGMMIVADYGHTQADAMGDTFQAVRKHGFCPPLEHAGDADLTSHVDFAKLAQITKDQGATVCGPITQKEFLETLGIRVRLQKLIDFDAKNTHLAQGVERVTDAKGMGHLFKVMAVAGEVTFCRFYPAGFQNLS